jgi:hypothetical protein
LNPALGNLVRTDEAIAVGYRALAHTIAFKQARTVAEQSTLEVNGPCATCFSAIVLLLPQTGCKKRDSIVLGTKCVPIPWRRRHYETFTKSTNPINTALIVLPSGGPASRSDGQNDVYHKHRSLS